ncbi:hypothetical protein [Noviherbaspirillum autotrophicum]|uniref:Uncharacterized protein n=1 Tax=Noviherbaspirillum autotrophicum TaxID=709839 RepID=A0A0C2BJS5_9BURK|nr:hypothetical protein [Noviherbaspirillum autotrophicum]KIF81450.1 hypothetical protein TSA66_12590 [Noviherbaspirillum autotrophicum]
MRTLAKALCLVAALAGAGPAGACGVCIDDKVAAVYDHEQVTRALNKGRVVVVCELTGAQEGGQLARQAGRTAQQLRGVEPGSVRAAPELPVLSFVLDPGAQSPETAVDGLRQRLRQQGITPTLLKVLRAQPAQERNGT